MSEENLRLTHFLRGGVLAPDLLKIAVMALATPHLHLLAGSDGPETRPMTSTGTLDDAFAGLAPGERRIARALYDAQMGGGASGSRWADSGTRLRTLDEIAEMQRNGAGWSQVFKQLKAEGVIAEQTLGHVVARWTRCGSRDEAPTPTFGAALRAAPSPAPSRTV
jgi:hypothetical protein